MTRRKKKIAASAAIASLPIATESSAVLTSSHYRAILLLAAVALFIFYAVLSYLSRGNNAWWYIDFVAEGNVLWGDDAYRYFIARSAWINSDVYWFNFTLPVAVAADGILTTLASGQLLYARWLKSALTVVSVFLVYQTCIRLQLSKHASVISATLLALMPLYFFVSISFFGESWLAVLISAALYFHVGRKENIAAALVSLMPLVRPEGIFFVAAYSVFAAARRSWLTAVLPLVAGGIYFFMIILIGPGLEAYSGWRFEMMKIYEGAQNWYGGPLSRLSKVFFLPWLALALFGLCLRHASIMRPFLLAGLAVIAMIVGSVVLKTANFEPRYLAPIMPILAVGFALAMDRARVYLLSRRQEKLAIGFVIAISVSTLVAQFFSVYVFDHIRQYYIDNGELPREVLAQPSSMGTYFKGLSGAEIDSYREFAGVVTEMMQANPGIKTLVVSNFLVFYFLDPEKIPSDVRVVFAIFGRGRLDSIVGQDKTAGYFASEPFYGEFALSPPVSEKNLLLYLDRIPAGDYPYHWRVGDNDIFLFNGKLLQSH